MTNGDIEAVCQIIRDLEGAPFVDPEIPPESKVLGDVIQKLHVLHLRLNDTARYERRKFAAMAMQGMLADPDCGPSDSLAMYAVKCADALLKELEK